MPLIRIATRTSPLARWQARFVADRLAASAADIRVEFVPVRSGGDRDRTTALKDFGGIGAFTSAVQNELLEGRADVAVHSLKDLPTEPAEGLVLACVPKRAACSDVLILPADRPVTAAGLDVLPHQGRVGTGSPRRQAQLLHARPDLVMKENRGNVETRIARLDAGDFDAIVLAEAGLQRLGLTERIRVRLNPPIMLPAVGQGALGIECRSDDSRCRTLLKHLIDEPTWQAVRAERRLLHALRAGCHAPVGVYTQYEDSGRTLSLTAVLLSPDGRRRLEATARGPAENPEAVGQAAADDLLAAGGDDLL